MGVQFADDILNKDGNVLDIDIYEYENVEASSVGDVEE